MERRLTTKELSKRVAVKSAIVGAALGFSSFVALRIPEFAQSSAYHHSEPIKAPSVTLYRNETLTSIPPNVVGREIDDLMRSKVVGLDRLGQEAGHFLQELFGR